MMMKNNMLNEQQLAQLFKTDTLPIKLWDGRPRYYSNLKQYDLSFTQRFGETLLNYSQFGLKGHNGIDIAGVTGTPIVASHDLWLTETQNNDTGYGIYVRGETDTKQVNGEFYKMQIDYGHFKSISVKAGVRVKKGTDLGLMNSTGFSTGSHLHYGIRYWYSTDGNTWIQCFKDNGYKGWSDPELVLPHIVYDMDEILHPKKGIGLYKPKGYQMIKYPDGTYTWSPIK